MLMSRNKNRYVITYIGDYVYKIMCWQIMTYNKGTHMQNMFCSSWITVRMLKVYIYICVPE